MPIRVSARPLAAAVAAITCVLLVAGCTLLAGPLASPTPVVPSLTPAFGLTWARAPKVELPADAFAVSSHPPTGPANPDTAGHPGNFPGQAIIEGVATSPGGDRLVAVGYGGLAGNWQALAWTSTDGVSWQLVSIDERIGSFAVAVAAAPGGGFAAVGRVGSVAAAWHSSDGQSWTAATVASLVMRDAGGPPTSRTADQAERMTSVLGTTDGLLAGGSVGPELGGDHRARFWHSTDGGATWQPVVGSDAVSADAEVASIAPGAGGAGFVALGRLGTLGQATASIAWTSADGFTWRRSDDPALAAGRANAVAAGPGGGLVAVGSDADEREAVAWTSPDGTTWTKAPTETSRLHSGEKIRMTGVVGTASGLVGIGNYVGLQYGTGTSWLSSDALHWTIAPDQPTFGQGEPEAVIAWRDSLVIVGSRGAPDNYIPTVWLSPGLP